MTERLTVVALTVIAALVVDHLLGEPTRFHPVVGLGSFATWVESEFRTRRRVSRLAGSAAVLCVMAPVGIAVWYAELVLARWPAAQVLFSVAMLYICIHARALKEEALKVHRLLATERLDEARQAVLGLVRQDTASMDEKAIVRGTIESLLENGSDAIFSTIFWFLLFGPTGAVLHRVSNWLDSWWGHRDERYLYFGWCAARLDDVMNYIPARLSGISYGLVGNARTAFRCWRQQAGLHPSPNGGVAMAAGAGALEIVIGGAASYEETTKDHFVFGMGRAPDRSDILRATKLLDRSILVWCVALLAAALCSSVW